MAIRVKLPNGEIGEFPDDMPHEEIESVLQKQFPYEGHQESNIPETPFNQNQSEPLKMKERIDSKSLMSDLVHGLGSALREGTDFAVNTPGMIKSLAKHLKEKPFQTLKHEAGQLAAGITDTGKSFANIGLSLASSAAKHLDPLGTALMEKSGQTIEAPQIPEDTGVEKFLGLEPTEKEDRLIRAIPELYGGGKLIGGALGKVKKAVTAPSKDKLFQRALEERINQIAEKTSISEGDLKALQDSLKLDYSSIHGERLGEATPIPLREGINVGENKLAAKKSLTEIPERAVGEIPPEPDLKAIISEKKEAVDKAKAEADKALGSLDNPRLKGAEKVSKAIKDVHKSASDLYKSARQHYVDKNITADNSAKIKDVTTDLEALKNSDELAPGYGSGSSEQKALQAQIDSLKGEKVNASDIFDLQRTLEKMAEDTRKKQYSGVNDIEFKRLNGIAERLDSHADKLAKRLEDVGGKDVQKLITEANKGWKTYKDLSSRNPVGKAALKGEIPMRSMIEIAKTHPGNDFLKTLVDSDPELKKHMLASYAGESNANKLLKPTSLVNKYIKELPEVEEHVNALKEALRGVKEGEVKASKVKKEYDDLVTSMKDAAKEQKVRRDAIDESDKIKAQIKFKQDAIPKIETKMKEVEANSSEQKRLEKELDDHKKFIQDKGGRLKELAKFFVKVKAAGSVHL